MKITIPVDTIQGKENLILSDEMIDNDNFVELIIGSKEMTVCLNDVMPALIAFDAKRKKNNEI